MLREKECNLKPRIYKVDYILNVDGLVDEREIYFEAESNSEAIHKWVRYFHLEPYVSFVCCTEVSIQWN